MKILVFLEGDLDSSIQTFQKNLLSFEMGYVVVSLVGYLLGFSQVSAEGVEVMCRAGDGFSQYGDLMMEWVDFIFFDRFFVEFSFSSSLIEDGYFFRNPSIDLKNQFGDVCKVFDFCLNSRIELSKYLSALVFSVEVLRLCFSGRNAQCIEGHSESKGFFDQKMGSINVKLRGVIKCKDESHIGVNPFFDFDVNDVLFRDDHLSRRGYALIAAVVKRKEIANYTNYTCYSVDNGDSLSRREVYCNDFVVNLEVLINEGTKGKANGSVRLWLGLAADWLKPCDVDFLCKIVASTDGNRRFVDYVSWMRMAFSSEFAEGNLYCSRCFDYDVMTNCMEGNLRGSLKSFISENSFQNALFCWRFKKALSQVEAILFFVIDSKDLAGLSGLIENSGIGSAVCLSAFKDGGNQCFVGMGAIQVLVVHACSYCLEQMGVGTLLDERVFLFCVNWRNINDVRMDIDFGPFGNIAKELILAGRVMFNRFNYCCQGAGGPLGLCNLQAEACMKGKCWFMMMIARSFKTMLDGQNALKMLKRFQTGWDSGVMRASPRCQVTVGD